METGWTRRPSDELVTAVRDLFPRLTPDEQRISVALYQFLAQGRPVAREALAARVGLPLAQVDAVLREWYGVFYSAAGEIIGYWGLTLKKMKHRFRVNGRLLFTWCAWDTLFIPQILGAVAEVESTCPATGDAILLTVGPSGIQAIYPDTTAVSFVTPEQAKLKENIVLNFCHYVHFFRSATVAESWLSKHPGTRLLTLAEAWALGREKNAAQYAAITGLGNDQDET
ncbi:MAG: alkylmercury lyase MerB [Burkholderiales bacterium]